MKKTKSLLFSGILFLLAVFVIVVSTEQAIRPENVDAQADTSASTSTSTPPITRLSGYAWSENIGWISFKDGSTPVRVKDDGSLVGYAWSENIGWVQFGGLSGFPNASYGGNAKLNGNTLSGWARAVAGVVGDNRGGWDGWIALNNVTIPTVLPTNPFSATGCRNGCAWGSDVVGWVDFSGITTSVQKNSCTGTYGTIIPDGSNFTFYSPADSEGACTTQIKNCVNGVLSPNSSIFSELSCGEDAKAECIRGGKRYLDGDKVVFYSKAIAGTGQTCESFKAELECVDGEFQDKDGNVNLLNKNLKCINNPSYQER